MFISPNLPPAAEVCPKAAATGNSRIGLIATKASIRTGAYERLITTIDPVARVFSNPCPLFVPLVENGRFRRGDVVIETVAREYLKPLQDLGVDTLVLGCTHYPLLTEVIGDIMGPNVTLIDAGAACAQAVADKLEHQDKLADPDRVGTSRFFVSDSTEGFAQLAEIFLGQPIAGQVQQINIEQY